MKREHILMFEKAGEVQRGLEPGDMCFDKAIGKTYRSVDRILLNPDLVLLLSTDQLAEMWSKAEEERETICSSKNDMSFLFWMHCFIEDARMEDWWCED